MSYVNEIHLSLLKRLMKRFHYKHADRLVHIFEIVKDRGFRPDGNILR